MHTLPLQVPLRVYTRSGALISQIGEQRRVPVTYDEIPQVVREAFLAAEDDRFFKHGGIDYFSMLRSIYVDLTNGDFAQGGSTITMQTARNMFLTRDKNITRKLQEIFLTLRMEHEFTKQEILETYLNVIFLASAPMAWRRRPKSTSASRSASCRWPRRPCWRTAAGALALQPGHQPAARHRAAPLRAAADAGTALHRRGHRQARHERRDQGARVRAALRHRGAVRGGNRRASRWSGALAKPRSTPATAPSPPSTGACRPPPTARCGWG